MEKRGAARWSCAKACVRAAAKQSRYYIEVNGPPKVREPQPQQGVWGMSHALSAILRVAEAGPTNVGVQSADAALPGVKDGPDTRTPTVDVKMVVSASVGVTAGPR